MSEDGHQHYLSRFDAFAAAAAAGEPAWMQELRREAVGRFGDLGLPTRKLEAWKHTSTAALAKRPFELHEGLHPRVERERVEALAFPLFACSLYVFVNGEYAPELSTPQALSGDLHVESLALLRRDAPERLEGRYASVAPLKESAFAALNTAFASDGAVVRIAPDTAIEQPIHLVFVSIGDGSTPRVAHPRVLLHAEPGSEATILLDHVSIGSEARFTNALSEVIVERNASLRLTLLQRECETTHHVSGLHVHQERDSRFRSDTLTLGGAWLRNDLAVQLAGEGAECDLRGLFLGLDSQHIDNHTEVDHALPHCSSRQLYKGILGDRASGVFRGRVIVRPDAQQTDAQQSNPNLLLGDGASINTKPQLEIYADDVKCSHGSTIGQLDADALFYLRARGIETDRARDLLTQGFAAEITRAVPAAAVGERVQEMLLERLHPEGER